MGKTALYICFDYDHDEDLKILLVGQAKNSDSPFEISDSSIKVATPNWKDVARTRIKRADEIAVLCGEHTDTATGVSEEIRIAREEKKTYFLLTGRANKTCKRPKAGLATDKMYDWTWDNLKKLIGGAR